MDPHLAAYIRRIGALDFSFLDLEKEHRQQLKKEASWYRWPQDRQGVYFEAFMKEKQAVDAELAKRTTMPGYGSAPPPPLFPLSRRLGTIVEEEPPPVQRRGPLDIMGSRLFLRL